MMVAELLAPLDMYNIKYIKICANNEIYIYNMDSVDKVDEIFRWFGSCQVREWRADFGDSLLIIL